MKKYKRIALDEIKVESCADCPLFGRCRATKNLTELYKNTIISGQKFAVNCPLPEDKIEPYDRFEDMSQVFTPGDIIAGDCNGYFGNDMKDKICVYVRYGYAVFEYLHNDDYVQAIVLNYDKNMTKSMISRWKDLK